MKKRTRINLQQLATFASLTLVFALLTSCNDSNDSTGNSSSPEPKPPTTTEPEPEIVEVTQPPVKATPIEQPAKPPAPVVSPAPPVKPPPVVAEPPKVVVPESPVAESSSPPVQNLQAALDRAKPGDVITFTGKHWGKFRTKKDGTASKPIVVRGVGNNAIIEVGNLKSGYGMIVQHDHYIFEDFTIQNAKKGLVVEHGANHGIIRNVNVKRVGMEGFKFRYDSQYWLVQNCSVDDTGNASGEYGEGYYVGNADSNWNNKQPDRSGYITFLNCRASNLLNDGFDLKEGSHHIKIIGCVVDFSGKEPQDGADKGDSGIYIRCDHVQVIDTVVIGQDKGGAAIKSYHEKNAVDGKSYGSNYDLYAVRMENPSSKTGLLQVKSEMASETHLYDNYDLDGGKLYHKNTQRQATVYPASKFKEMTWSGIGGDAYLQ